MKKHHFYIMLLMAVFMPMNALALQQNEGLWLGFDNHMRLSQDRKWLGSLFSQFRLVNKSHPWQLFLLEGGVGYELPSESTIWVGYRWTANQPNNGFYQQNRLFQQFIHHQVSHQRFRTIIRSRLEELYNGNQSKVAVRLRERLSFEIDKSFLHHNLYPRFYDEVILQFNKTDYTPHTLFSENRVFIGFNFYHSKAEWLELGYLNQFVMRNPRQTQNQMNHVMAATYNF